MEITMKQTSMFLLWLLFLKYIYLFHVCACTHTVTHIAVSRQLVGVVLSFHHVDLGPRTWVIKLIGHLPFEPS